MSLVSEGLCLAEESPEASERNRLLETRPLECASPGVLLVHSRACLTSLLDPGLLQLLEPWSLILVTASSSHFCRYLENHLANLFAGAWESRPEGPLPLDIPQASPQQVIRLSSLAEDPHLAGRSLFESVLGPCLWGLMVTHTVGSLSPICHSRFSAVWKS